MNTLEAIKARRSVKHYDPEHKMSEEEIHQLIELAMLAPTAFNLQHWRFVAVQDSELRQEIRKVAWDQAQVTDASLLLILCANLDSWKNPEKFWKGAPQAVQDILVPAIDGYYKDNPQVQRDECMRSCGLAAQTIMLAAKSMGYDSCPMDGFDFDAVGKLINLPDNHVITMFVVVGKGTQQPWPKPGQLSREEVLIKDKF